VYKGVDYAYICTELKLLNIILQIQFCCLLTSWL